MEREEDGSKSFITFFTFDVKYVPDAKATLESWLHEKEVPASLHEPQKHSTGERHADTLIASADGREYSRLRMVEKQPSQNYHTEVVLGAEPDQGWLSVRVWSDGDGLTGTPRFVSTLLDDKDGVLARSSLADLKFELVDDLEDAEALLDYLVSPRRQLPVFIAGTDEVPDDPRFEEQFRETARRWSRGTLGLARFSVLGPDATAHLEERLGGAFAPQRWSIRTYEPRLVLDDVSDARRHRFIGTESLSRWPERKVRRRLERTARILASRRGTPSQLRRGLHSLTQQENLSFLRNQSINDKADPRAVSEEKKRDEGSHDDNHELSTAELAHISIMKQMLGNQPFTEDHVMEIAQRYETGGADVQSRLNELTSRIDQLTFEREELQEDLNASSQSGDRAETDQQLLRQQVQWLQGKLSAAGDPEAAYAELHSAVIVDEPRSFEDLMERMAEYRNCGVCFTGDPDIAERLDDIDTQGQAVHNAWISLQALTDYLRARNDGAHSGDLWSYIRQPPSVEYTTVPIRNFSVESKTTMDAYGDERTLPVPDHISETGLAIMEYHFKLHKIGMKSPRMHVLDQSAQDGCVYVGYIGPHLRTPSTN